ncbi:hypothetical protein C5748_22400 [Phyllobacterium phragmitis]|uniref:DUF995 domain-containing protein n=1 Tax=Phyllobacterium phragmitis TaxID=2670329 RepID=A0A2S9IL54_9HYPH|nr:DUF995 domain-containing protein [Phyllobacterium phragmitis]PRD41257.1 hypothetical protein C5748_22400 [Phyllobacterium phragmitis]
MMKTNRTNRETWSHGRFQGWLRVSSVLAGIVLFSSHSGASEHVVVPENARVMTGVELYTLYRDKTWKWADGAGRMQDKGRVFKAVAGSGETASRAEGRWIVTDRGQLCFKAAWHTQTGTFPDKTCFSHKTYGGTVFQKREPSGDWYVFKNSEPTDSDEFSKLVREDLVSAQLEAIQNPPQNTIQ